MGREAMEFDVVVVGAGPAGLAAAIRLKQLAAPRDREVSVCVLEKGSEVGAHILSGAVIDPIAITELFPDWKERGAALDSPVTDDRFLLLGPHRARPIPNWLLPPLMSNHGIYVERYRMLIEGFELNQVPVSPSMEGAVSMAEALRRWQRC